MKIQDFTTKIGFWFILINQIWDGNHLLGYHHGDIIDLTALNKMEHTHIMLYIRFAGYPNDPAMEPTQPSTIYIYYIYCVMTCHLISCHVILSYLMSCHVMSSHVMSSHVMSSYLMSSHVMSSYLISCHVMSSHVMSSHVISCHVISCHVMSSYLISCHVMPSYLMSCHVILFYLMSSYFISCHVMSSYLISCHVISCHVISVFVYLMVGVFSCSPHHLAPAPRLETSPGQQEGQGCQGRRRGRGHAKSSGGCGEVALWIPERFGKRCFFQLFPLTEIGLELGRICLFMLDCWIWFWLLFSRKTFDWQKGRQVNWALGHCLSVFAVNQRGARRRLRLPWEVWASKSAKLRCRAVADTQGLCLKLGVYTPRKKCHFDKENMGKWWLDYRWWQSIKFEATPFSDKPIHVDMTSVAHIVTYTFAFRHDEANKQW